MATSAAMTWRRWRRRIPLPRVNSRSGETRFERIYSRYLVDESLAIENYWCGAVIPSAAPSTAPSVATSLTNPLLRLAGGRAWTDECDAPELLSTHCHGRARGRMRHSVEDAPLALASHHSRAETRAVARMSPRGIRHWNSPVGSQYARKVEPLHA